MKRNPFLRVKLKSLAEEARIIRIEEMRANENRDYDLQRELRDHRAGIVRRAARETLLAYQYLRGIPYDAVERPGSTYVNWQSVRKMVVKYGGSEFRDPDLKDWYQSCKIAA